MRGECNRLISVLLTLTLTLCLLAPRSYFSGLGIIFGGRGEDPSKATRRGCSSRWDNIADFQGGTRGWFGQVLVGDASCVGQLSTTSSLVGQVDEATLLEER